MINPFDKIVSPDPGADEEVAGQFFCFTCNKVSNKALYFGETKLLVWHCPEGHRNHIEDFDID